MPTIRIDDEVYDRLKERAEPFVDTPNTVLRRLLELDADEGDVSARHVSVRKRSPERARAGELLHRHEYDLPILAVLVRRGGSSHKADVVADVGTLVADRLTQKDRETNRSGVVRWENRVMWRRFNLMKMGLLKEGSPRGIWEISDAGRRAVESGEINYPSGGERIS